jgi:uncharacterized protein (UPF0333 family)
MCTCPEGYSGTHCETRTILDATGQISDWEYALIGLAVVVLILVLTSVFVARFIKDENESVELKNLLMQFMYQRNQRVSLCYHCQVMSLFRNQRVGLCYHCQVMSLFFVY